MSRPSCEASLGQRRLANSLELVLPALDPELVNPDRIPCLRATASVLPPLHRAGFECRLAPDAPDVDLQQGIFASEGEPARLARFLTETGPENDAWQGVRVLAQRWCTPGDLLNAAIAELWLEFDSPGSGRINPLSLADLRPSPFVLLNVMDGPTSLAAARRFLNTVLDGSAVAALDEALSRCARACSEPARISHVGAMLGRPTPAARVHASPIPLRELAGYLAQTGWSGNVAEAQSLAAALLDCADLLVVCLDVVEDGIAGLGLECFFSRTHGLDPRWPALLDRLARLGLCSAEKADALVQWPGVLTPLNGSPAWPDDLIAQSLTQPEEVLGVVDRRLSHVKVTLSPDLPLTAKAYFGYGHVWTGLDPRKVKRARRVGHRPAPAGAGAIDAAASWLLGMRNQAGWWQDFFGTPNVDFSDEWVTAYIGDALARVPSSRTYAAAREALGLLLARRVDDEGWGYHAVLPPDGDATTWALRLARSLGAHDRGTLTAGRRLLERLTSRDGGVASYTRPHALTLARFLGIEGTYDGWCSAHSCISAPAALLDNSSTTSAYLRASQSADGSWPAYWWEDDEYATAWAAEALTRAAANRDAVNAAVAWATERIGPDGAVCSIAHGGPSPFATALALHTIQVGGSSHDGNERLVADRARDWLLEHQLEDGSWEPAAHMRVPFSYVRDPSQSRELIDRYICDAGSFTTATVVVALSASRVIAQATRTP